MPCITKQRALRLLCPHRCSVGNSVLQGSFGTVNLTATGTGNAYISGVNETVTLALSGKLQR